MIATPAEEFQPAYSPDGAEAAYLYERIHERTGLRVVNLKTKAVRTILDTTSNYSYSDGDRHFRWSRDGKWFLVTFLDKARWPYSEVSLVAADGKSPVRNLTESGYGDNAPEWAMNGAAMIWSTDRDGFRSHGSWGAHSDVYAMFFSQEAFDKFRLTKDEYELLQEQKKDEKKDDKKDEKKDAKKDDDKAKQEKTPPLKLELNDLEDRTARLTAHSSNLGGMALSPDAASVCTIWRALRKATICGCKKFGSARPNFSPN